MKGKNCYIANLSRRNSVLVLTGKIIKSLVPLTLIFHVPQSSAETLFQAKAIVSPFEAAHQRIRGTDYSYISFFCLKCPCDVHASVVLEMYAEKLEAIVRVISSYNLRDQPNAYFAFQTKHTILRRSSANRFIEHVYYYAAEADLHTGNPPLFSVENRVITTFEFRQPFDRYIRFYVIFHTDPSLQNVNQIVDNNCNISRFPSFAVTTIFRIVIFGWLLQRTHPIEWCVSIFKIRQIT